MTIFSLTCNLRNEEDRTAIAGIMEAWNGKKVMDSTWILKRNDGCTCRDIIDDLLDHISATNEIFVVEIGRKNGMPQMEKHCRAFNRH